MMYPLVEDLAVDGIPVAVTCRVLGFSKQAFYAWTARPVSRRDLDDAYLINAALDIHTDDPVPGRSDPRRDGAADAARRARHRNASHHALPSLSCRAELPRRAPTLP